MQSSRMELQPRVSDVSIQHSSVLSQITEGSENINPFDNGKLIVETYTQ
jgi:hypothetical protein